MSPTLKAARLRIALAEMFALADRINFDFDLRKSPRAAVTAEGKTHGGTP